MSTFGSEAVENRSKKIDELNQKLGPEYLKLVQALEDIEPNSPDGQELAARSTRLV